MQKVMVTSIILGSFPAAAQEHSHHEAHVHGHSTVNIAVEKQKLHVELLSPGADIVGFEHQAHSLEEKQKLSDTIHRLKQFETVFLLPDDAQCSLDHAHIEIPEKKKSDANHASEERSHSSIHAHYGFDCAKPEKLNAIEFSIFEHFSNVRELEVQYVNEHGSTLFDANPKDPAINLK